MSKAYAKPKQAVSKTHPESTLGEIADGFIGTVEDTLGVAIAKPELLRDILSEFLKTHHGIRFVDDRTYQATKCREDAVGLLEKYLGAISDKYLDRPVAQALDLLRLVESCDTLDDPPGPNQTPDPRAVPEVQDAIDAMVKSGVRYEEHAFVTFEHLKAGDEVRAVYHQNAANPDEYKTSLLGNGVRVQNMGAGSCDLVGNQSFLQLYGMDRVVAVFDGMDRTFAVFAVARPANTGTTPAEPPVLCFVRDLGEGVLDAYFTTQSLDTQQGDDWDDVSYEHNAGEPYPWHPDCGKDRWEIVRVSFAGRFQLPNHNHVNSPYSVHDINRRRVIPWLRARNGVTIAAGTTLADFQALVAKAGGAIFTVFTYVVK